MRKGAGEEDGTEVVNRVTRKIWGVKEECTFLEVKKQHLVKEKYKNIDK